MAESRIVELNAVAGRIGDRDRLARHRDHGSVGFVFQTRCALRGRRDVGDENRLPDRDLPGFHVADIEDVVGEVLVEDARLDFGRELRGLDLVQDARPLDRRLGRKDQRSIRGQRHAKRGEEEHRRDHLAARNAGRAHGDNFAVARKAAQADQDSHQHAEGNRQRQQRRNSPREKRSHRKELGVAADKHFKQPVGLVQERYEGRKHRPQQRTGQNLAKYVTAEDAHAESSNA